MTPCEPVEVHKTFVQFNNLVHVDIDDKVDLKTFIASYVQALKVVAATGDRIFLFVNKNKASLSALKYMRDILKQRVRVFITESEPVPTSAGEANVLRIALATHGEIEEFLRCIRSATVSKNNTFAETPRESFDKKFWPIEWKNLYRYRGSTTQSFISLGNGSNSVE